MCGLQQRLQAWVNLDTLSPPTRMSVVVLELEPDVGALGSLERRVVEDTEVTGSELHAGPGFPDVRTRLRRLLRLKERASSRFRLGAMTTTRTAFAPTSASPSIWDARSWRRISW